MKSTLKVTVTSAVELTEKQVKKIVDAVEKKYSENTVELKQVVNPSVIAGVKLTIGSQEIDATASTKLAKLHQELKENL
ncbi:F0F1 ATP synthase subunit delta [Candidatus Woesebacteria bacterium]|nr:F0F1 ATP synthase subunit delta [Candidatus Woesebacteria bacterium]